MGKLGGGTTSQSARGVPIWFLEYPGYLSVLAVFDLEKGICQLGRPMCIVSLTARVAGLARSSGLDLPLFGGQQ